MSSIAERMSDMAGAGRAKAAPSISDRMRPAAPEEQAEHSELHPNGDGTYRTKVRGEEADHQSFGAAMGHLAKAHGEVEGGHDRDNIEALKAALDQFFTEEENEGHESPGGEGGEGEESILD